MILYGVKVWDIRQVGTSKVLSMKVDFYQINLGILTEKELCILIKRMMRIEKDTTEEIKTSQLLSLDMLKEWHITDCQKSFEPGAPN